MSKIKRAGAWLLAAALTVGLLPAAGAASVPKPQTKTVKVAADNIYSSLGDVSVEVTYTGWLGEIASIPRDGASDWIGGPAGNTDKIAVLKEGSEIRFTIKAKDPMAYYNFCYDGIYTPDVFSENIVYGWDDCGGGTLYFYSKDGLQGYPIQVYGNKDGTSSFQPGNIFEKSQPFGRKLGSGQYAYTAYNGLLTYAFNAKPARDENNDYFPNDYTARYVLGSALTVNDEQIKEMQETGAMTFLDGTEYEYQYAYPGVAELFGLEEKSASGLTFYFDDSEHLLDNGHAYSYTLTNNSDQAIKGCYALLSYRPRMMYDGLYSGPVFHGQLHKFDLDLQPHESFKAPHGNAMVSNYYSLSSMKMLWIEFDSPAEREQFFANSNIGPCSTSVQQGYYLIEPKSGAEWMKSTLGITILPAK